MTIEQMRNKIMSCYNGKRWHERCLKMPDNQVYAVYRSLESRNFNVEGPKVKKYSDPEPAPTVKSHQMDMFEYISLQQMAEEKYPYEYYEDEDGGIGRIGDRAMHFVSEEEYKEYLNDLRNDYMDSL